MSDNYTTSPAGKIAVPSAMTRWSATDELPVIMGDGMIKALARKIADDITRDARSLHGPVTWITGNSMVPPLREIAEAERVWQAASNDDGEQFACLAELVEAHLANADVALECPDYDNALYAVDLRRWRYRDDDGFGDDLNDDWMPVS